MSLKSRKIATTYGAIEAKRTEFQGDGSGHLCQMLLRIQIRQGLASGFDKMEVIDDLNKAISIHSHYIIQERCSYISCLL